MTPEYMRNTSEPALQGPSLGEESYPQHPRTVGLPHKTNFSALGVRNVECEPTAFFSIIAVMGIYYISEITLAVRWSGITTLHT